MEIQNRTPRVRTLRKAAQQYQKACVRCIWMPIVSTVIASVNMASLGVDRKGYVSSLPNAFTGIVLILAYLIFRCRAELREQNRFLISDAKK